MTDNAEHKITKCKLCGARAVLDTGSSGLHNYVLACGHCGEYKISDIAYVCEPDPAIKDQMHLLSGLVRLRNDEGAPLFQVTSEQLCSPDVFRDQIASQAPRTIQEKADVFLRYLAVRSQYPGDKVVFNPHRDTSVVFAKSPDEAYYYRTYLLELGLIVAGRETDDQTGDLIISPKGWDHMNRLGRPNPASKQAFVAMWFDPSLTEAFLSGIQSLEHETGFAFVRIDMTQFNDKICDRILAEIRKSRFIIADVTGHRQGVYFEAGFALGLGLPVIWTCRADDISHCHFDTRQYNHVTWESPQELREKLRDRILATIGLIE